MSTTRFSFRSLSRGRIAIAISPSAVAAGLFWTWYRKPDPDALVARAYDAIQKEDCDSASQALRELHQHDRSNAELVEMHFRNSPDGGYSASNENDVKIALEPHKHVELLRSEMAIRQGSDQESTSRWQGICIDRGQTQSSVLRVDG